MTSEVCKKNFGRDERDPFTYGDLLASVAEEDRERMKDAVRTSIELRQDYAIEYRIITPKGDKRWVEVRGQTFSASAAWDNADWVDVTFHSYRARWDEAEPDPRSAALEAKVMATKALSLPTLYIQGAVDGVNPPETSRSVPSKFTGSYERVILDGVGHFAPREAPDVVADKLIAHFRAGT